MSYEATLSGMGMPVGSGTQIGSQTASTAGLASGQGGGGAIAAGAISGLTNIANTWINASAAKSTAKFNQAMLGIQGRMMKLRANEQIKDIRKRAQSLFGTQMAQMAKSGLAFSGSPAAVMMESLKQAELDEIFSNLNVDLAQAGLDTQAGISRMEANRETAGAYQDTIATLLNMGTKAITRG